MPSNSEGKDAHKDNGKRREDPRLVESASSLADIDKPKRRKHSQPQSPESPTQRFAFDVPSPDDIVLMRAEGRLWLNAIELFLHCLLFIYLFCFCFYAI